MSTPPFIKINWVTLTAQQKYATLMQVFEGCKEGVPMPSDPKASRSKIDNFGFSSWKKFAEGGRHCSIEFNSGGGQYEFTPLIYLVEKNGLYGIKSGIEHIPLTAASEEFVATLERVLEKIPALAKEYYQQKDKEEESEDDL